MKKLVSLLLVSMMVLLTVSATAEEFSLRNGIQFGDTMDDVLAKETLEISESGEMDPDGDYSYYISTGEGTVADIDFDRIDYYFDANQTLCEVLYVFKTGNDTVTSMTNYFLLVADVCNEYGAVLGNTEGELYPFVGAAIQRAANTVRLLQMFGGNAYVCNYDEWVIDLDEGHVKIETAQRYALGTEDMYDMEMSYTYFTDDDLAAAQAENQ